MSFQFAPATKAQAKARIALAGPSGSGKTFTSLTIARTLGDRVALIDTERGSASKYADQFAFDTLQLHAFDPRDLTKALAAAGAAGYPVCIVDSLSHFWSGTGGMLEQVDHAAKRSGGGNSFAGWKEARPMERAMVDALLAYPGHVIVTMRTKTEYVVDTDERGRKVPRKVGLKPEQREGIEYEFDIVADLDQENTLVVSKSRCRDLSGAVIRRPDEDLGKRILAWLEDGTAPAHDPLAWRDAALAPDATRDELLELYGTVQRAGMLGAPVVDGSGDETTLGDLIKARGKEAADRAAPSVEAQQEERRRKRMHILFGEVGYGGDANRDRRLAICAKVLGLTDPPESTKDLTAGEVELVISALEERKARQAVPA